MQDFPENDTADLIEMAAYIVSAYVSKNSIRPADLSELITSVHHTLGTLGMPPTRAAGSVDKAAPAQVRKSITPDALISFEDGKAYKTLRRHLATRGLTPEAYRAKYGLPADYPMTSPNYSVQRSELARNIGLGQVRSRLAKAAKPDEAAPEAPKRRGRSTAV